MKIGHLMPEVKVQILFGEKAITKVNIIRVTPDTGTTADLISNKFAYSLGCKVKKDSREYRITGVNRKELRRVRLPSRD